MIIHGISQKRMNPILKYFPKNKNIKIIWKKKANTSFYNYPQTSCAYFLIGKKKIVIAILISYYLIRMFNWWDPQFQYF